MTILLVPVVILVLMPSLTILLVPVVIPAITVLIPVPVAILVLVRRLQAIRAYSEPFWGSLLPSLYFSSALWCYVLEIVGYDAVHGVFVSP